MKRPLHTILFILVFLLNIPQHFATNCISNGGGEWNEPSTWLCNGMPGVPQPGDNITIKGPDIVTISTTVDLSTEGDNNATWIIITGTLKFWPQPGCEVTNTCGVDLILDSGSEIIVPDGANIKEDGPGNNKNIIIGGQVVLQTSGMPFGPGILPEDAPLPVKVVSFTGIAMERSNMLEWQTESEENAKEFILERSATGRDGFVEIANINANGFSENIQTYVFEDEKPLSMAYYKLKMVDFDGSFEYSEIIALEKPHEGVTNFEVFPVPIQDEVTVRLSSERKSNATLRLTNYLGQIILMEKLELNAGVNEFKFNWGGMNSGLHFITIENDQERLVKKVF